MVKKVIQVSIAVAPFPPKREFNGYVGFFGLPFYLRSAHYSTPIIFFKASINKSFSSGVPTVTLSSSPDNRIHIPYEHAMPEKFLMDRIGIRYFKKNKIGFRRIRARSGNL